MTNQDKNLEPRSPIVVVMGHIDHGKTTLLDWIRKSNVAQGESGGITQHIGAYEVFHATEGSADKKKITFLDTPGHEAFFKMRSRGARIADIAVLVVAADDGVKPQTQEALEAIREASLPFVVAINKIDKPAADVERTKSNLAAVGIYLEGRGGIVPAVEICAKDGRGVDQLLDTILLLAELENFSANLRQFASGVVIESHRDAKRGIAATLLIRNGTLKKGEYVAAGPAIAKVKIFENVDGCAIDEAGPSSPVVLVGFDVLPPVGVECKAYFSQKDALSVQAEYCQSKKEEKGISHAAALSQENENGKKKTCIGLLIKSDTEGSAEAIEHEIEKVLGEKAELLCQGELKRLRVGAGDVSEDDIKFVATAEHPTVIAFKVKVRSEVTALAERLGVHIASFEVIYEIADFLNELIEKIFSRQGAVQGIIGKAKILKLFKSDTKSQVTGGQVLEGVLKKGSQITIVRRDHAIGEGKIENLQSGKLDVPEIASENEFGALIKTNVTLAAGDFFEVKDQ